MLTNGSEVSTFCMKIANRCGPRGSLVHLKILAKYNRDVDEAVISVYKAKSTKLATTSLSPSIGNVITTLTDSAQDNAYRSYSNACVRKARRDVSLDGHLWCVQMMVLGYNLSGSKDSSRIQDLWSRGRLEASISGTTVVGRLADALSESA